jgi:hypothetical protein
MLVELNLVQDGGGNFFNGFGRGRCASAGFA